VTGTWTGGGGGGCQGNSKTGGGTGTVRHFAGASLQRGELNIELPGGDLSAFVTASCQGAGPAATGVGPALLLHVQIPAAVLGAQPPRPGLAGVLDPQGMGVLQGRRAQARLPERPAEFKGER